MKEISSNNKYPTVFWYFFIATFINKAGSLIMPFLSCYLNDGMNYNYEDTGWVFFFLGLGTVFGTFFSGWFVDNFGSRKVILFSLTSSALFLIIMSFTSNFTLFCFLVFCFSFTADMLRPAILTALKTYVHKDKRVEAYTLIRRASNLGLILGPFVGGYLMFNHGAHYQFLFFIDATTCLVAAIIIGFLVNENKLEYKLSTKIVSLFANKNAMLKDNVFLLNNLVACICGILFFQFFSVFPLYYNSENFNNLLKVDYLISGLALCTAVFELFIVNYYVKNKLYNNLAIGIGLIFFTIGYLSLSFLHTNLGCFIYVLSISLGAMHTFPFAISIVLNRIHFKQEGAFMALFQMSYGFSQMISGKINLNLVATFGFKMNWTVNIILALIGFVINYIVFLKIRSERKMLENKLENYF